MTVDEESLRRLRALVMRMRDEDGAGVSYGALVEIAAELEEETGLTVDFAASQLLGQPLVVVERGPAPDPMWAKLTPREREVAACVGEGMRNKEIAAALGIGLGTVKDHVHNILSKTGLKNRAAIAAARTSRPPSR